MTLDAKKIKSELRYYIGDIVDDESLKHMFLTSAITNNIVHLRSCIMISRQHCEIYGYVKSLIETIEPEELNKKCFKGETILYSLMKSYADQVSLKCIELLINHCENIDLIVHRRTPLFALIENYNSSSHNHYVKLMNLLVINGANINFEFNYGSCFVTSLFIFIMEKHICHWDFVEAMLDGGATCDLSIIPENKMWSGYKLQKFIETIANRSGRMTKCAK
jgi:hypothetical protein